MSWPVLTMVETSFIGGRGEGIGAPSSSALMAAQPRSVPGGAPASAETMMRVESGMRVPASWRAAISDRTAAGPTRRIAMSVAVLSE